MSSNWHAALFFIVIILSKIVPGILKECVETNMQECMCFVQLFEHKTSPSGETELNSFDCPKLELTKVIIAMNSHQILSPASIVITYAHFVDSLVSVE